MPMRLEGRHAEMFALSKYDQAELALQHGRLDLEFARLKATQPPPATEDRGSNLIEALNANAAAFAALASGDSGVFLFAMLSLSVIR